jgi:hypothetical protein
LGSLLLGARTNDSQDTPTFLQWHFVKKKSSDQLIIREANVPKGPRSQHL